MEDRVYSVYCHTLLRDGRRYIGITSSKPAKRWCRGKGYKQNEYFYATICKYGWDAFSHEVLYTGLTMHEASCKEIELIEQYNTRDCRFGFNHGLGGVFCDTRLSNETKAKLSAINKGKKPSNKGVRPTEDQLLRWRLSNRQHFKPVIERDETSGVFICYESEKEYIRLHKGMHDCRFKPGHQAWNKNKGLSEDTRLKLSKAHLGKMRTFKWYTDGIREIRAEYCPEGFHEGRIRKGTSNFHWSADARKRMSEQRKGRLAGSHWYTDGEHDVRAVKCPDGYYPGRSNTENLSIACKQRYLNNPEERDRLRKAAAGRKPSEETIEKRRIKLIGRKVSEETRNRIHESRKPFMRPVVGVSLSTGEARHYESINATSLDGFLPDGVSNVVRGRASMHKNWKWYYEADYNKEAL